MKPVSIRIAAFGPYLKEQFIDFSDLTASGIFLISGETGSGKTVILDAMTYALYGKSSGGGRGDISAMRCANATESDETIAEYVFDIHGKRYKFIRMLKFGRKNLNTQQNVLVMNEDGVFEPIFENPKMSDLEKTAEKLLGLTYEQFRQVIILPQGQFEQLLTSNSKDKEKILTSLFNTEKWETAAKILYAEAAEQTDLINRERLGITALLEENGCKSAEELSELYEKKKTELSKNKKLLKKSTDELEKMRTALQSAEKLADKFKNFENGEKELERLTAEDGKIKEFEELLKKSNNAEKLNSVYNSLKSARNEKSLRGKNEKEALKSAEICKKSLDFEKKKKEELESKKSDFDEKSKQISILTEMTEIYRRADSLKKELKKANDEAELAQKEVLKIQAEKEISDEKLKKTMKKKAELYTEYSAAVEKYTAALCASLAEDLSEGMPCPVCGSTSHPEKAKSAGEAVTESDLKALRKKIEINDLEASKAEGENKKVSEKLEKANADCFEKKSAAEKVKTEYEVLTEKTDKSIKSEKELENKISELKKETENFASELEKSEENVKKLSEECAVKEAAAKNAAAETEKAAAAEEKADNEFKKNLEKHGFDDEKEFLKALVSETEKEKIEKSVSEHKINKESILKNISSLREELSKEEKPETAQMRAELEDDEKENKKLVAACALSENDEKRIKKLCTSIKKQNELLKQQSEKAEENLIFSKRLRGDNGISLKRYILGIMLSSVISSANKLLENVHGGRYKLYRTDESSGSSRIKGLEFSVYDRFSAKNRSVSTLSGGEKFLAALSLSIGLSSVIRTQSGGIEMGAMFIDEGFGTLDSASVSDALSVLGTMKRSDAVIGIISHVGILKENISAGIEITKTERGSTLKIIKQ